MSKGGGSYYETDMKTTVSAINGKPDIHAQQLTLRHTDSKCKMGDDHNSLVWTNKISNDETKSR